MSLVHPSINRCHVHNDGTQGEKTSWPSAMFKGIDYDGVPHPRCIDVRREQSHMHELRTQFFFHPSYAFFFFLANLLRVHVGTWASDQKVLYSFCNRMLMLVCI